MSAVVSSDLRDQLLAQRIIPPAEVESAERQAVDDEISLESVLVKKRMLSEVQLDALKALRENVSYCNLSDFIPRLANSELVSEEIARRHVVFPLFDLDGVITLVMADPHDLTAIDQIRKRTRREVEACLAGRSDILGLIERAYGATRYLEHSATMQAELEGADLPGAEETQPVIRLVDDLLNDATRQRASDVHIEPGDHALRIRVRVDGVLREVAAPPAGLHKAIVSRIKVIARLDISKTRTPQDGAFHHRGGDYDVVIRVSVLPSVFGEAVVLRILRNESESISLEELGMARQTLDRWARLIASSYGMILVSGPTGSGKSTTLYAALKSIASPQKNIIAIEDPVEYRNPRIRQVQVNPDAKLTFATGLRSILRQDPDVIMVGEIRDAETAQIAVQSSLTGHLVLSTVHTNDAVGAVARLREIGIAPYLISASLLGVLGQRLCRRICPDCSQPDSPSEHLIRAIGLDPPATDIQPRRGKGCRRCVGTGYTGRVGIFELFCINERYSAMISDLSTAETIRSAARADGMRLLVDDGVDKIRAGLTTVEEVARVAGRS